MQDMRAVTVKPGMGKFPFIGTFDAELLNQNWMQECASQKREDYYRVAVISGK
jgi:hypothetical protein